MGVRVLQRRDDRRLTMAVGVQGTEGKVLKGRSSGFRF